MIHKSFSTIKTSSPARKQWFITISNDRFIGFRRASGYILNFLFLIIVISILSLTISRLITLLNSWSQIYPPEQAPFRKIAIVFGAGLRRDGTPTPVLKDRVDAAASLYFHGKVEKLLMSGGIHSFNYNEPQAMRDYAILLGVPSSDILMDFAGHNTYQTCLRAKKIYKVEDAILVTQSFHLPRALYTCNAIGVQAIGTSADMRIYRPFSRLIWNIRELPATVKALWDVHISRPGTEAEAHEPVFLNKAQ